MKFVALFLLCGIIGANAASTTDLLIENILNPLLDGIQTNAINYLLSSLLGLLGIGKRGISNIQQILTDLFNAHKDKLTALLHQYTSQLQSLTSNFFGFLGPKMTHKQMSLIRLEANFAEELKTLNANFAQQVIESLLGQFNHGAMMATLSNFFDKFEGVLTGAFDSATGSLFQTLAHIATNAIPQLQQLQGQIQTQLQQLISSVNFGEIFNLLG